MGVKNKTIVGSDLCNTDCSERNDILHPETNIGQLKTGSDADTTLLDWINHSNESDIIPFPFETTTGLLDWLRKNYPLDNVVIPDATPEQGGIVRIDSKYFMSEDGILSLRKDGLDLKFSQDNSYEKDKFISAGTLSGLYNSTDIGLSIPKPEVNINIDNDNISVKSLVGGIERNSSEIAISDLVVSLKNNNSFNDYFDELITISRDDNNIHVRNNITGSEQLINIPSLYSAGKNVSITNDGVISAENTTYNVFSSQRAGLVPQSDGTSNKVLKSDGSWDDISISKVSVDGFSSNGLSVHKINDAGFKDDSYVPILISKASFTKTIIGFEYIGSDDGNLNYAEFILNNQGYIGAMLCKSFYSSDESSFSKEDFIWTRDEVDGLIQIVIYKKKKTPSSYIINVLSESNTDEHHFFYNEDSSVMDMDYQLHDDDERVLPYIENYNYITSITA